MQDEVKESQRLASMRAGLISVGMLMVICFALSFVLGGSDLDASTGDEAEVKTAEAQP